MSAPMAERSFAGGGAEPWGEALRGPGDGTLQLRRAVGGRTVQVWRLAALFGPADADDLSVLDAVTGPLLDVGCGPGRMVRAAAAGRSPALGIDVSTDAVLHARAAGIPALVRSIFDRLPLEGRWAAVLLMDGNVGIGGDPDALVTRCRDLLAPGGVLVVEADADPDLDDRAVFTVRDDRGHESDAFPWARLGWRAAIACAEAAGLREAEHVVAGTRHFVRARRP